MSTEPLRGYDETAATLTIRRIRPDEYDEIGSITLAAYEEFTTGANDSYRDRLRATALRDREAEVWVAERAGRLLGSVTMAPPGSSWREIARPDEGEFRMLAVDPSVRNSGAGTALVRTVLDRFAADGMAGMAMSSLAVMTSAHRVYERFGFVRDPERDWSPAPGVGLVAFVMRW